MRASAASFAALLACSQTPDAPNAPAPPPKDAAAVNILEAIQMAPDESLFMTQAPAAAAVFVGTLTEVGPPPGTYSGYRVATQALTYQVKDVLRGDVAGPTLTVHALIVAASPALVPGKPELAPAHTQIGVDYLVAVGGTMEGKRVTANENVGPLPATPERIARARAALVP